MAWILAAVKMKVQSKSKGTGIKWTIQFRLFTTLQQLQPTHLHLHLHQSNNPLFLRFAALTLSSCGLHDSLIDISQLSQPSQQHYPASTYRNWPQSQKKHPTTRPENPAVLALCSLRDYGTFTKEALFTPLPDPPPASSLLCIGRKTPVPPRQTYFLFSSPPVSNSSAKPASSSRQCSFLLSLDQLQLALKDA